MSKLLTAVKCLECNETFTPDKPLSSSDKAAAEFLTAFFNHGCPVGSMALFNEIDAPEAAA